MSRKPSWAVTVDEMRGTRIPDDWQPEGFQPDTIAHKIASGWTAERLQREAEKFRAYWKAKRGAKALKMDWQAAWVMWTLKADQIDRSGSHGWAS